MYFLAKGDGSGTTAFAKTFKQHQANIKKYAKPAS
jgi:cell division protein YceG involved in septum cleavage